MKRLLSLVLVASVSSAQLMAMQIENKIPFSSSSKGKASPLVLRGIALPNESCRIRSALGKFFNKADLNIGKLSKELFVELFIGLVLKVGTLEPDSEVIQDFIKDCNTKGIMLWAGDCDAALIKKQISNLLALPWGYNGAVEAMPAVDRVFIEKLHTIRTIVLDKCVTPASIDDVAAVANCFFDELYAVVDATYDGCRKYRLVPLNDKINISLDRLKLQLSTESSVGCASNFVYESKANFLVLSSALLDIYEVLGHKVFMQEPSRLVLDPAPAGSLGENEEFFLQGDYIGVVGVAVICAVLFAVWQAS